MQQWKAVYSGLQPISMSVNQVDSRPVELSVQQSNTVMFAPSFGHVRHPLWFLNSHEYIRS